MRLLVVGFASSVHTARYLQLLDGSGWDVHLFDSYETTDAHPELPPLTLHAASETTAPPGVRVVLPDPDDGNSPSARAARLARVIDELHPQIVHSHEIQRGAALVDTVRRGRGLPAPWLVTNWGSDIWWFGRDSARAPRIRSVMSGCDYYGSECHRDVGLARAFGFRGRVIGVWPVAGGVDVEHAASLRAPGPTSGRRAIAVKGAVTALSRAEVAFAAVERCLHLLDGWELCTYQMDGDLEPAVKAMAEDAGMTYTCLSGRAARQSPHDELLRMHGRARVSLGLNKTDGLSTSFVEAIAMGSFAVQSNGSCGGEITPPGRGALFVPADDLDHVTEALHRALTDDALVDEGARINERAVAEHLDRRRTRARVLDAYERIVADALLEAA